MQKPWIIGFISIIPGLGLIALGYPAWGIGVISIIGFLVISGVLSPWETVSIICFTLAVIAWGSQWFYAILIVQRQSLEEAGLVPTVKQVSIEPLSPDASSRERFMHKTRQVLIQLLQPDEVLRVALVGRTGVQSIISILFLGDPSGTRPRMIYLGITENDFILVLTDLLEKPVEVLRRPLEKVSLVNFKDGFLVDELDIDLGGSDILHVHVSRKLNQGTRQLVEILSGKEFVGFETMKPSRQSGVRGDGNSRARSTDISRQGFRSKHPYVAYTLLGAAGGIIGTVVAAILSMLIVLFLNAVFNDAIVSDNDTEGFGYLIGLYCFVMFPIGGALVGGIPGWVIGAVRIAQGRKNTILPPLLGGLITVIALTTGAWLGILLL